MTKTNKPLRELLKKSHAHQSKKDYKRKPVTSDQWADHVDGMPHLEDITDKTGALE